MAPDRSPVLYVGGPDVEARLDLMSLLASEFQLSAIGTAAASAPAFDQRGFPFSQYAMSPGIDPLGDLRAVAQLARFFRARRPTIVHTFDTKPGVYGRVAARLAKVPVVVGTLPGLGGLYAEDTLRARAMRSVYQPLQRLASGVSDATVFQNGEDAREFVDRRVVSSRKARVLEGSGIRTDVFQPGNGNRGLRDALGIPAEAPVVLMVSRVLRSKGVLEYAAAAESVHASRRDVHFLLAGAADDHRADRLRPSELTRLRGSVAWLGRRDDIKDLMQIADVFALPSYYREGIPRALLEAASSGLPLVAANVPGSREVVRHGETGFLVPPRDAGALAASILELVGDHDAASRLGASARRLAVARFDVALLASATADLYRELLAAKRGAPSVLR